MMLNLKAWGLKDSAEAERDKMVLQEAYTRDVKAAAQLEVMIAAIQGKIDKISQASFPDVVSKLESEIIEMEKDRNDLLQNVRRAEKMAEDLGKDRKPMADDRRDDLDDFLAERERISNSIGNEDGGRPEGENQESKEPESTVTTTDSDSGTSNELWAAHEIIKKLRRQKQGKPDRANLQQLADRKRKKTGALNFRAMGRDLGVSHHTVSCWCKVEGIE